MYKILILIFLYVNAYSQQERGMRVIAKDPQSGSELGVYNELWAVVVGVDKYQYWKQLNYAVKDAEKVAEVLTSKYGFRKNNIILLRDNEATLQGIKNALGAMISRAGEDDGVIFFFAGHGQTFKTRDGKERGYLIPVDGKKEDENLYSTGLAMSEVKNLSNLIPAKHTLFLIDACYSGLAAASEYRGLLSPETEGFLRKVVQAKTRHIITAGSAGEQVQENDEWGHSAFTYELLNGLQREQADLNNDRIITADELAEYLTSRVSLRTNNAQVPQSRRLSIDEGKFVFVPTRGVIENMAEVKPKETEKSEVKKKEDIKPSPTEEIVIEPELKSLRGFYVFLGLGYGHAQNIGVVVVDRGRTIVYSMGLIGYKISESLSLEARNIVS